MTLKELKDRVDLLCKTYNLDSKVVIPLDNRTLYGSHEVCANVTDICADCLDFRVLISVDRKIVEKDKDRDIPMPKV